MSSITKAQVLKTLATVEDPELHKDLVSLGFIQNVEIQDKKVSFTIMLTTPACPLKDKIRSDCEEALKRDIKEIHTINIHFDARVRGDKKLNERLDIPFKNVIAVGAGKGGVGKSTIAVNLALALAREGAVTGLLDADIYGPNIPTFMGITDSPEQEGDSILPIHRFGIEMMSMGFLVSPDQALVWRGPMIHSALNQLLTKVKWSSLDYLVVDLPPGTGDAQMSLAQQMPLTGAVIVTTPQAVSVSDTRRGVDAFRRLDVPILGIIENMAGSIFGSGGGEKAARELQVPFLGRLPLDQKAAQAGEAGTPLLSQEEKGEITRLIIDMAGKIAGEISTTQFL